MKDRTIGIGCDHGGFELKEELKRRLLADGYEVTDKGIETLHEVDYPDIAVAVASGVTAGEYDCAILICGTGIGISIMANKFKGIRAALCADHYDAKMTRSHNDANILCMGGRTTGEWVAVDILETFLNTEYDGGFHDGSLELIREAEEFMMNGRIWSEEPRKISTGPLKDSEIFDRKKKK